MKSIADIVLLWINFCLIPIYMIPRRKVTEARCEKQNTLRRLTLEKKKNTKYPEK